MSELARNLSSFRRTAICVFCAATTGCANLNSIERRTSLPMDDHQRAVAIHLDNKQRVVVSHSSGIYCAEPNPDAISAASSGQGASAGVADRGSGAVSLAAQESVGSIGLRTQSIELQREIYYRLCEAYYNQGINDVQLGALLSRSQDMTAVLLAVEQLTGAVAANQVMLTGSAGATAASSIVSNQKSLEAARSNEQSAKDRLDSANQKRDAQKPILDDAIRAASASKNELDAEKNKPTPDAARVASLQAQYDEKDSKRNAAQEENDSLSAIAEQARLNYDDAKRVRETIETALESSMAAATSNATGSGQFTVVSPRNQLSAQATEHIANAVESMVTAALNTDQRMTTCLAVLALNAKEEEALQTERNKPETRQDLQLVQKLAARQGLRSKIEDACLEVIKSGVSGKG